MQESEKMSVHTGERQLKADINSVIEMLMSC